MLELLDTPTVASELNRMPQSSQVTTTPVKKTQVKHGMRLTSSSETGKVKSTQGKAGRVAAPPIIVQMAYVTSLLSAYVIIINTIATTSRGHTHTHTHAHRERHVHTHREACTHSHHNRRVHTHAHTHTHTHMLRRYDNTTTGVDHVQTSFGSAVAYTVNSTLAKG